MANRDKEISGALNKLFSKSSGEYVQVKGARNYLKIALQNAVGYCYIDCYVTNKNLQYELVTIVQNLKGAPEVYKNPLNFQYSRNMPAQNLDEIQISIAGNQNVEGFAVISICYRYQGQKLIFKQAALEIDIASIRKGEVLLLEDISVNKNFLQIRWHPYYQQIIIGLTEETFEIMSYQVEGIQRIKSFKIKDFQVIDHSIKIVDFCFWNNTYQQKSYNIIAIGRDGTLLLFVCKIFEQQQGVLLPTQAKIAFNMPKYQIRFCQYLQRPSECNFRNVEAYAPSKGILLLFKTASSVDISTIIISALVQIKENYIQQPLISIQSKKSEGHLKIPYSDLFLGYFYFWHGEKLSRVNLNVHIDYLKALFENPNKAKPPPTSVNTEVVVEVKENIMKFVAVDVSAIKILRKAQNSHQYMFSSLAIQTSDLMAQQQSASKMLYKIFGDMQKRISQITSKENNGYENSFNQPIYSPNQSSKTQQFDKKINAYSAKVSSKLKSEQKELEQLYKEADNLTKQFTRQKSKWRQLQEMLSRIQNNSIKIKRLEKEDKAQNSESRTVEFITQNCKLLISRPLQIDSGLRKDYFESFKEQQRTIQALKEKLLQNETILYTICNDASGKI